MKSEWYTSGGKRFQVYGSGGKWAWRIGNQHSEWYSSRKKALSAGRSEVRRGVRGLSRLPSSKGRRKRKGSLQPARSNPKHNWVMPTIAVGALGLAGWYFFIRKPTPPPSAVAAIPAKTS